MSWLPIVLLFILVLAGMWSVVTSTLLYAAIALAFTSVMLALLMYAFEAPLAAVFELSVCAGLITVVFVSAISLTRPGNPAYDRTRAVSRFKRFVWLPLLLVILTAAWQWAAPLIPPLTQTEHAASPEVREVLWNVRRLDLVGQLLLILAGVFGVVVLFKGWESDKGRKA